MFLIHGSLEEVKTGRLKARLLYLLLVALPCQQAIPHFSVYFCIVTLRFELYTNFGILYKNKIFQSSFCCRLWHCFAEEIIGDSPAKVSTDSVIIIIYDSGHIKKHCVKAFSWHNCLKKTPQKSINISSLVVVMYYFASICTFYLHPNTARFIRARVSGLFPE